jgi:hypothetical protein
LTVNNSPAGGGPWALELAWEEKESSLVASFWLALAAKRPPSGIWAELSLSAASDKPSAKAIP